MGKILSLLVAFIIFNFAFFRYVASLKGYAVINDFLIANAIIIILGLGFFWFSSRKKNGDLIIHLAGCYIMPVMFSGVYYGFGYLWDIATFIPRTIWNFFFG
tara:strand:+ start:395 stop:700 length:306 start_codon:yes stop_codon:yes gene_type:complete